jgi:hypothetical protein
MKKTAPKKKTNVRVSHYIVTKRGLPCALVSVLESQRAGVLLPSQAAETFDQRRRANAAVRRTERAATQLRQSMVRDWLVEKHAQARELIAQGEFVVLPIREAQ